MPGPAPRYTCPIKSSVTPEAFEVLLGLADELGLKPAALIRRAVDHALIKPGDLATGLQLQKHAREDHERQERNRVREELAWAAADGYEPYPATLADARRLGIDPANPGDLEEGPEEPPVQVRWEDPKE